MHLEEWLGVELGVPAGVLADNAAGMHPASTIYSDMDPEQIGSLSPAQPHREVDLAILDADAKGASFNRSNWRVGELHTSTARCRLPPGVLRPSVHDLRTRVWATC